MGAGTLNALAPAAVSAALAADAAALGIAGRRRENPLDERLNPVVFINADHLYLDLLSLGQVFIDVADVGIGDFGNVHQPGFSPRAAIQMRRIW